MSALNVNTINSADGTDNNLIANGKNTCKAWINFNGQGTVAIRDDYNVDSITDNSSGNYTLNLTTTMADTNYCPVVSAHFGNGSSTTIRYGGARDLTTSNFIIEIGYQNGLVDDSALVMALVYGDQ